MNESSGDWTSADNLASETESIRVYPNKYVSVAQKHCVQAYVLTKHSLVTVKIMGTTKCALKN